MEPSIFQTYSGGPYDVCIRRLPLYNSIQKPLKSLVYEGLTDEWTNCCLSCLIPVMWLGYTSYSYFDSGEGSFVAGLCILYQFLVSGFLSFCCISRCLKGDTELQYLKHLLLIIPPNNIRSAGVKSWGKLCWNSDQLRSVWKGEAFFFWSHQPGYQALHHIFGYTCEAALWQPCSKSAHGPGFAFHHRVARHLSPFPLALWGKVYPL